MDESFHGLEGRLVGFFVSHLFGELLGVDYHFFAISLGKFASFGILELFVRHERRHHSHFRHFGMELLDDRLDFFFSLGSQEHESLDHIGKVGLAISDTHAIGHGVVKIRNRLTTVLVVLVRLNSDSGQSGVATDILRFTQMTVTGIEAILEKLLEVDLAAGHGKGIEIQIVDMDIAFHVGTAVLGLEHHHRVEVLGRFGTVLEHGAHSGVAIDVRVFTLEVGFLGRTESDVAERMHKASIHFAHAGTFGTVQDVALRGIGVATFGKRLFYSILDFFDFGNGFALGFEPAHNIGRHLESRARKHVIATQQIQLTLGGLDLFIKFTRGAESLDNSIGDFFNVERHLTAVTLPYRNNHLPILASGGIGPLRANSVSNIHFSSNFFFYYILCSLSRRKHKIWKTI